MEAAQAHQSLFMSKYHTVGNFMSRLKYQWPMKILAIGCLSILVFSILRIQQ